MRSLASIDRTSARVKLPLRVQQPRVRAAALAAAARQARVALSAPVRLQLGQDPLAAPPRRIARLLELPVRGPHALKIGGTAADAWVAASGARVEKPAQDATFAVHSGRTSASCRRGRASGSTPSAPPTPCSQAALKRQPDLRSPGCRCRSLKPSSRPTRPERCTSRRSVSNYTTLYGGIANRIHNVELVAHLVDGTLIAPGATFSFNQTTGDRNAAKGFLEAPVIVNGELTTGLGGGVCQVSTTVFNAAFEAGLKIVERTNHALYISHYPQGRDATVDYPAVDLKFVNDTGNWLLLRTFVSSSSLTVGLYGTPVAPQGREQHEPARLARSAAGEEDRRPVAPAGREDRRRPGRAGDVHERHARCLRAGRQAPVPRLVVLLVPCRAEARASRPGEGEAEEGAGHDHDRHDDDVRLAGDSAVATASLSHSGTRVGASVTESTHA